MNYDGFFSINGRGDLIYDGPRPKTLEEAWDISIAKWRRLSEREVFNHYGDGGPLTCGLCMLFFNYECMGCPIFQDTGIPSCTNTPYEKYCGDMETARAELEYLLALRERQ